MRLYNRALSAEEVKKNAIATGSDDTQDAVVADGLVGHWNLEDTPTTPPEIQQVIDKAGLMSQYRNLLEKGRKSSF